MVVLYSKAFPLYSGKASSLSPQRILKQHWIYTSEENEMLSVFCFSPNIELNTKHYVTGKYIQCLSLK